MSRPEKPGTDPHRPRMDPTALQAIRVSCAHLEPVRAECDTPASESGCERLPEAQEIGRRVLLEASRRLLAAHGLSKRSNGPRPRVEGGRS